jgi:hypothetical protein
VSGTARTKNYDQSFANILQIAAELELLRRDAAAFGRLIAALCESAPSIEIENAELEERTEAKYGL